jgi:hypothetical protein
VGSFAATAIAAEPPSSGATQGSARLVGSSLTVTARPMDVSFRTELRGAAQEIDGAGSSQFTVVDARGTGSGWQVTMKATPFVNATVPGKHLPPDSFVAPQFHVVKGDATSSALPGELRAAPIDNESGAVVASCTATGQGMGAYEFTAGPGSWKLHVSAHDCAGVYTSVVTVTVAPRAL